MGGGGERVWWRNQLVSFPPLLQHSTFLYISRKECHKDKKKRRKKKKKKETNLWCGVMGVEVVGRSKQCHTCTYNTSCYFRRLFCLIYHHIWHIYNRLSLLLKKSQGGGGEKQMGVGGKKPTGLFLHWGKKPIGWFLPWVRNKPVRFFPRGRFGWGKKLTITPVPVCAPGAVRSIT